MPTLRSLLETKIRDSTIKFDEVSGAADLASIVNRRTHENCCYLFRSRQIVSENSHLTTVTQKKAQQISIIVITRNVKSARGIDSSDENEAFCDELEKLLLGWPPSEKYRGLTKVDGYLISFKNESFIWQEIYQTSEYITNR